MRKLFFHFAFCFRCIKGGKRRLMKKLISLIALAFITGCAGITGVVQTGPDTYMVASHSTMGWSSGSAQKAKSFEKANAFCKDLGKQMQVIRTDEQPGGFGKIASGEVEFRCIKLSDIAP